MPGVGGEGAPEVKGLYPFPGGLDLGSHIEHNADSSAGCVFSPDRVHRYALWRVWDASKPMGVVLGINPSTAAAVDAQGKVIDDATTRVLKSFGDLWGWGGYWLGNPFAYRSTDQRGLLDAADPVGPGNDAHLARMLAGGTHVLCAWGPAKTARVRKLLDVRLREMRPLFAGKGAKPTVSPGDLEMISWLEELLNELAEAGAEKLVWG